MKSETALASATHVYLNFISLAAAVPISPPAREAAASRYIRFREMAELDRKRSLVPTRDISLVWAADMLRPTGYTDAREEESLRWYEHQHMRLLQSGAVFVPTKGVFHWNKFAVDMLAGTAVGAVMGAAFTRHPLGAVLGGVAGAVLTKNPGVTDGVSVDRYPEVARLNSSHGLLSSRERRSVLRSWMKEYTETQKVWQEKTSTRYRLPLTEQPPPVAGVSEEAVARLDAPWPLRTVSTSAFASWGRA